MECLSTKRLCKVALGFGVVHRPNGGRAAASRIAAQAHPARASRPRTGLTGAEPAGACRCEVRHIVPVHC
jgi:hypothetical protein